jgi:hypothetical protein
VSPFAKMGKNQQNHHHHDDYISLGFLAFTPDVEHYKIQGRNKLDMLHFQFSRIFVAMYFGHGGIHRSVSKIHGFVKIGIHRGFVSVDLRLKNQLLRILSFLTQ